MRTPHPGLWLLAALTLLLIVLPAPAQAQPEYRYFFPLAYRAPLPAAPATGPIYGIDFISAAELVADAQQYQNGLLAGAAWNRWPLYWFNVESSPGSFTWTGQDAALSGDINHGLHTNAILLGTPDFYQTGLSAGAQAANRPLRVGGFQLQAANAATPQGLYDPMFSDGSDVPGPGKQINRTNRWAYFVSLAVQRYRPGGTLSQQRGWPQGAGITTWEVWNEPDLPWFWDGSLPDYARLLKVAYLAIKHVDPGATVLFAGLANNFAYLGYYDDVLAVYDGDPLAAANGYFHDVLATHSYFYAWQSWYHVWRAGRTQAAHGLDKPIWLNESGVPAWDDYPGPVWDPRSALRATMEEQAAYIIQSALYARFAGADAVFHFQLYDGCGNQPAGTNFPPHSGELCDANGYWTGHPGLPCAGDANGLFRNPADDPRYTCFTRHPQPETARPALAAFQVLTTHARDIEPYWRRRPGPLKCVGPGNVMVPPQEWIAFYQPATQQRVVGLWTLCSDPETAIIQATNPAGTALLVAADGSTQTLQAQNGQYTIQLPGATHDNPFPDGNPPPFHPIGGRPYLLIELDPRR